MKTVILILLAASFVGFWLRREEHAPKTQSIIASLYFIGAVVVVFGGIVP